MTKPKWASKKEERYENAGVSSLCCSLVLIVCVCIYIYIELRLRKSWDAVFDKWHAAWGADKWLVTSNENYLKTNSPIPKSITHSFLTLVLHRDVPCKFNWKTLVPNYLYGYIPLYECQIGGTCTKTFTQIQVYCLSNPPNLSLTVWS